MSYIHLLPYKLFSLIYSTTSSVKNSYEPQATELLISVEDISFTSAFKGTILALKFSILTMLLIMLLPNLIALIISFGGLLINLYFPKLKWDNETAVVKQSMSVLLTMILGVLLTVLPVGVNYLFKNISLTYVGIISALTYALVLAIIIAILFTKGIKLFRKIKC